MATDIGIYFTAGYPNLNSTLPILRGLSASKVNFIEVGVPFSDPLADGPVIQESSKMALENGITLSRIFDDLALFVKEEPQHPTLLLMGYLNSFLSYGMEKALVRCKEIGVSGLILPDMPYDYYNKHYKQLFLSKGVKPVFLISPDSEKTYIDELAKDDLAFIYVLSQNATTGKEVDFISNTKAYFEACKKLESKAPKYLGFGISSAKDVAEVAEYLLL